MGSLSLRLDVVAFSGFDGEVTRAAAESASW
jgi:hypothetical protein